MSKWPAIADIAAHVQSGELRAVDLVRQSLAEIEKTKAKKSNR